MELNKEEVMQQLKEKQEAVQKLSTLIESLKDNRSRILGQISLYEELLKREESKT